MPQSVNRRNEAMQMPWEIAERGMSKRGKGFQCEYCERRLEATSSKSRLAATRDHYVAASHGGTYKVWCCKQCNTLKANLTPQEWRVFRNLYPRWWEFRAFKGAGINSRILMIIRRECRGPSPLTARTDVEGVTRANHVGNLVLDTRQPAGAACEQ